MVQQRTACKNYVQKKSKHFGHVKQMSNTGYPKILLEGHIEENRPRGRPEKRWHEDIRHFCKENGITSIIVAGHLATNRQLELAQAAWEDGKSSLGHTSGDGFRSNQVKFIFKTDL